MIVITGISGFVGSNLSSFLETKDKTILGVSRSPSEGEVDYENLNITLLNSATSFIHLAGKAHDVKKTSEDASYYEVNTELTKSLFDKFLKSTCEVFIYMSSVKAVADVVEGVLIEEKEPKPMTVYGKSKLAAESYISSEEIPKGKRVYILRPCMIHGPGNKGNLNLLYEFVSKGFYWPLGAFDNKRTLCSIDNLLFIINELLERKDIPSGVYNVCDDDDISTNEIISLIAHSQHRNPRILKLPKYLIKNIARWGDKLHFPLNFERLQKLTESYLVSNKKIIRIIGKPLPVSFKEGLLKTFNSFKIK